MLEKRKTRLIYLIIVFVLISTTGTYFYTKVFFRERLILTDKVLGMRFPDVKITDEQGNSLIIEDLKKEKAIIILVASDCFACEMETEMLKTQVNRREIKFYGIMPFGTIKSLTASKASFPFKTYLDVNGDLREKLQIDRVPIKMFLDHGVIRKVWIGSGYAPLEKDFINFMDTISSHAAL